MIGELFGVSGVGCRVWGMGEMGRWGEVETMGVNLSHITHDRILGVGYGVWGVGESEQFWLTMY
ncbi:hypothetical protein [Coleofasciculus sp. E2-BRE-01]|jgi:hypothetical protein|uniref:hypothetical protein n=1 Tax=Coleofasciculus sp. E2-BRE-01 TaxID=3069524 RepID=UPI0032F37455